MSEFLPPVTAVLLANIKQFRAGMTEAKAEMASVSGASATMAAGISKMGKTSGLVLLGLGIASAKMAADFQQNTSVLVTAAGESTKGLEVVRQGIKDVARETGTGMKALEDAAYLLEKAGYRQADVTQVLRAAAQGAREEGANVGTVIQAETSIMASYHLKASDAVRVTNALKTAAGEAKTTMEQYAGSLSTVLPIASANGIKFSDVAGALATLTQHGTTANEATQELASTIRNLAAPNQVAQKEMQALGLNVTDVQTRIGERGLTGTLNLLIEAITAHMGPAGTLLLNAFNQSKTAAQDADLMISKMPKGVAAMATAYKTGALSLGEYRKAVKDLPSDQANLLKQYVELRNRAAGFSDIIRSGSPAAQTFSDALKKMTGGAIGLNTALQLTGESAAGTKVRVAAVEKSFTNASKSVEGWETTSKLASVALGQLRETAAVLAVDIGTHLLPAITASAGWFVKHRHVTEALAYGFTGILIVAVALWIAKLTWAATTSVIQFGKMAFSGNAFFISQEAGFAKSLAGAVRWAAGMLVRLGTVGAGFRTLAATEVSASAVGAAGVVRSAAVTNAALSSEAATAVRTAITMRTALASAGAALGGLAMIGVGAFPDVRDTNANANSAQKRVMDLIQHSKGAAAAQQSAGLSIINPKTAADRQALASFIAKYGDASGKDAGLLASLGYGSSKTSNNGGHGVDSDNPRIRAAAIAAAAATGAKTKGKAKPGGDLAKMLAQLQASAAAAAGGGTYSGSTGGGGGGGGGGGSSTRAAAAAKKAASLIAAERKKLASLLLAEQRFDVRQETDLAKARKGKLTSKQAIVDRTMARQLADRAKALETDTRGTTLHAKAVDELHHAQTALIVATRTLTIAKNAETARAKVAAQAAIARVEAPVIKEPCPDIGVFQSMLALEAKPQQQHATLHATFHVDGWQIFKAMQPHVLKYDDRNSSNGLSSGV